MAARAKPAAPAAGYSGTPLPQKLGIKAGCKLCVLAGPAGFVESLGELADVSVHTRRAQKCDVIVLFVTRIAELERAFLSTAQCLTPAGGLWIAWPKKASGVATDMTEDAVRAVALPLGYVDNKVCAIDATWSGLRCVLRKEKR
ncbi:MAG TPA: hypothetical protein VHM70_15640 [Polyangiaceae bacterium]|jgi:hypothetical protein|nr:hypothetical protein [Polyangiaceae bacterium]